MKNLLTAWIVCKTSIFCLTITWEIHAPHIHVLHHQSCHSKFSLLYIFPSTFCQFMISSIIIVSACINTHICNQLSSFCLFICTNGQGTTWDFITYMRAPSPWKRLCFFSQKGLFNYNAWSSGWNMRNVPGYVAIIMGVDIGLFFLDNQVDESSWINLHGTYKWHYCTTEILVCLYNLWTTLLWIFFSLRRSSCIEDIA